MLAVATYGNRALPPAAIAERCQAWLGIAPRATAAALARLRHQGALLVDDDRRLEPSTAYKARARKEHSLFRFARENLEAVRDGELDELSAALLALLPSRSKPGTCWADSHGHLASLLGAGRSRVASALRDLEAAGRVEQADKFELRNGHSIASWSVVGAPARRITDSQHAGDLPAAADYATGAVEYRTGAVNYRTGAQSLTPSESLRPSVSTTALRLVTSAEPEPEPAKPVETRAAQKEAPAPESDNDRQRIVEDWTVRTVMTGIERLNPDDARHVAAVATLVYRLDPTSPPWFKNSRSTFARRLCRWAGHVEELGRWLVRVIQRRGPSNLLAYLRNASKAGDPGQVLRAELKNEMGRGAETFEVFSRATEKALEGPHCAAVAKLIAGTAKVLEAEEPAERIRMRTELAAMLARGNLLAAGRVLRHAFRKTTPTDEKLVEFIGDVCSLETARLALTA